MKVNFGLAVIHISIIGPIIIIIYNLLIFFIICYNFRQIKSVQLVKYLSYQLNGDRNNHLFFVTSSFYNVDL